MERINEHISAGERKHETGNIIAEEIERSFSSS
jgi:hypothetical protein